MAQNYLSKGDQIPFVCAGTVTAGTPFLMGTRLAIPLASGVSGQTITVGVSGVWSLTKATGAWTVGAAIYWDDTAKKVTTTSTSNTLIGWAVNAAASGDATGEVKLLC